jgi:hypothetical protein
MMRKTAHRTCTTLALIALLALAGCTGGRISDEAAQLNYNPPKDGHMEVVRGILRSNPSAGQPGIMMRNHYYLIGDYRVFTGGRRLPELEVRKGQHVALTGWVVEMDLEGRSFQEIRPVSVQSTE